MSEVNAGKNQRICAMPGCTNSGRSKGRKTNQRGKWCHSHHTKRKDARIEYVKEGAAK